MGREHLNELIKAKNRHQKKALAITAALAAAGSKQGTTWFKIHVTQSTIPTKHPISRPRLWKFRSSFRRAAAFVLAGPLSESWATEQALNSWAMAHGLAKVKLGSCQCSGPWKQPSKIQSLSRGPLWGPSFGSGSAQLLVASLGQLQAYGPSWENTRINEMLGHKSICLALIT